MDVNAFNASYGPATQAQPSRPPVKESPSDSEVSAAKAQARAKDEPASPPPQEPKPVTNAQGQTIGTRINVTA